jgi:3-oxoacyl-[acyl-carrier protein] reductase
MMQDVSSMSVLVTGGGSGLGAGIASHLARLGAKVTITGRRLDRLQEVAAAIGSQCAIVEGDVTDDADRRRMIDVAVAHGGGLQGLVNTAGNMLRGPITDLAAEDIAALLNTNVVAGMVLTGLAVPHLARDGGAVLFIGSVHTRRAYPGASPYAASKGAVEVLSRVLAAELGPRGIRVNCLLPGAVPTEINVRAGLAKDFDENAARLNSMVSDHPLGRIGTAEEIAEAAHHLLAATWTTGASLVVDGGLSLGVSYK